jgi:hypothetical protein
MNSDLPDLDTVLECPNMRMHIATLCSVFALNVMLAAWPAVGRGWLA